MALSLKRVSKCALKSLDNADIVREAILCQLSQPQSLAGHPMNHSIMATESMNPFAMAAIFRHRYAQAEYGEGTGCLRAIVFA
jgi:hypothetical protein